LGCFKTEMEAAKFVNFVCKKESMKIKNPELSDEETKTFTWPPQKVTIFVYNFIHIDGLHFIFFVSSIDKCLLVEY
jgi:hypothetical protein